MHLFWKNIKSGGWATVLQFLLIFLLYKKAGRIKTDLLHKSKDSKRMGRTGHPRCHHLIGGHSLHCQHGKHGVDLDSNLCSPLWKKQYKQSHKLPLNTVCSCFHNIRVFPEAQVYFSDLQNHQSKQSCSQMFHQLPQSMLDHYKTENVLATQDWKVQVSAIKPWKWRIHLE